MYAIRSYYARINDVYTRPVLEKDGSATVEVELELLNDASYDQEIEAQVKLSGKNFKSKDYVVNLKQMLKPGSNKIKTMVKVAEPKLWWPWDLGDQNLYNANVNIKNKGVPDDAENRNNFV